MNCVPWLIYDGLEDHLPLTAGVTLVPDFTRYLDHTRNVGASSSTVSSRSHSSQQFRKNTNEQGHQKLVDQLITSLPSLPPHMCDPTNMSGNVCPICLDPLVAQSCTNHDDGKRIKQTVTVTACNHHMHRQCLATWLSKDRALSCPVCRVQVKPAQKNLQQAYEIKLDDSNSRRMALDRRQQKAEQRQHVVINHSRGEQRKQVEQNHQQNRSQPSDRSERGQVERGQGLHGFRHRWHMSNPQGWSRHWVKKSTPNSSANA